MAGSKKTPSASFFEVRRILLSHRRALQRDYDGLFDLISEGAASSYDEEELSIIVGSLRILAILESTLEDLREDCEASEGGN